MSDPSPSPQSDPPRETGGAWPQANQLLDRYVAVWIWSIQFGTVAGLVLSLATVRVQPWGLLTLGLLIPVVVMMAAALESLRALYWALRFHLLPNFFPGDFPKSLPMSAEEPPSPLRHFPPPNAYTLSYQLNRAFWMLLWALIARFGIAAIEISLTATTRF